MNSMDLLHDSLLVEAEDDPSLEIFAPYTGDGSIDFGGHPALKARTGNWRACSLTIVSSFFTIIGSASISRNLVSYLTKVLHETNAVAARNVSIFQGSICAASLVGALLADSYLGKYWTVLIFYLVFIIGMLTLVLSEALPLIFSDTCCSWTLYTSAASSQRVIFFAGMCMVATGIGAKSACHLSFGADQFDDTDAKETAKKRAFFGWMYFAENAGALIAMTAIAWVQDQEGWLWGFTIPALCAGVGLGAFLAGSKVYRFQKPGGSPLTRACQVVVAAARNLDDDLPRDCSLLYELPGKGSAIDGSRKLVHTAGLGFLDRAAIVPPSWIGSAGVLDPWRICTVTQVEELKTIIRMLPIWITTVFFNVVMVQTSSTFVEQGMVMDNRVVSSFEAPPASLQTITFTAAVAGVPLYERVLVPALRTFTGKPSGISPLQRIGVGLVLAMLSMVTAALVEGHRLEIATAEGLVHRKVVVPMSILWQAPQYLLVGAGEVFTLVGLNEFLYGQSPDAMRSLCMALAIGSMSAGSYLNSLIMSVVPAVTGGAGGPGWIPDNLNEGHLDWFFWVMAGLCFLNLLAFVFCATRYRSKRTS